jgi:hypothetical protein
MYRACVIRRCQNLLRFVIRIDLDLACNLEEAFLIRDRSHRHERITRRVNCRDEICDQRVRNRSAEWSSESEKDAARPAVPCPCRQRFRDSSVAATEILIVFKRDHTLQREHSERRVLLGVRE